MKEPDEGNGLEYDGQWEHGVKNGIGTLIWPDRSSYKGQFVNGLKHGAGMLRWPNGSSYKGNFFEDQRHGEGIFKTGGGERMETWEHGELMKQHALKGAKILLQQQVFADSAANSGEMEAAAISGEMEATATPIESAQLDELTCPAPDNAGDIEVQEANGVDDNDGDVSETTAS